MSADEDLRATAQEAVRSLRARKTTLDDDSIDLILRDARSHYAWTDKPIPEDEYMPGSFHLRHKSRGKSAARQISEGKEPSQNDGRASHRNHRLRPAVLA